MALVAPGPEPRLAAAPAGHFEEGKRPVRFDGEWTETPVLRGEPAAGLHVEGPAIFELPEATFVVPPGWRSEVDEAGTIRAETQR